MYIYRTKRDSTTKQDKRKMTRGTLYIKTKAHCLSNEKKQDPLPLPSITYPFAEECPAKRRREAKRGMKARVMRENIVAGDREPFAQPSISFSFKTSFQYQNKLISQTIFCDSQNYLS